MYEGSNSFCIVIHYKDHALSLSLFVRGRHYTIDVLSALQIYLFA